MLITILVRTLRFVLPLKLVINLSTSYEKAGYDLWSYEGSDQGDGNPSTSASSTTSDEGSSGLPPVPTIEGPITRARAKEIGGDLDKFIRCVSKAHPPAEVEETPFNVLANASF